MPLLDLLLSGFNSIFSNIFVFIIFRFVFLAIGLAELYRAFKPLKDQKIVLEYKPTFLQEATLNLMTFGLVIFCFIIVLWVDFNASSKFSSFPDYGWVFIPIDIALGLFILIAYMIPKKVILTEEGLFHVGHLTPWKEVIDYDVNQKRDQLKMKHYHKFFSFNYPTETVVPLPPDRDELREELARLIKGEDEEQDQDASKNSGREKKGAGGRKESTGGRKESTGGRKESTGGRKESTGGRKKRTED